jgi:hypothetical protein
MLNSVKAEEQKSGRAEKRKIFIPLIPVPNVKTKN